MNASTRRRWVFWTGFSAAALLLLASLGPLLIGALDAGYFRGPLMAYIQKYFDRSIRIDGPLQLQLWSWHPRIVAQQVSIGNPPWVAAGDMARIGRLTLVYGAPGWGRGPILERIALQGATLDLKRDATGHANWQRYNPDSGTLGKGLPLIRELLATDAHVQYDDEMRHLQFQGTVSAQGALPAAAPSRLHVTGSGLLNGKPVTVDLNADPLSGVRRDLPYGFEFSERSSGARVDVHGSLPHPFDFNVLNGTFDAAGADLKDLYFLVGVTLVNTGAYHLTGRIERHGNTTRFDQLKLTTGQSDVAGSISSEPQGSGVANGLARPGRALLQGMLTAGVLHLADFGARATGGASAQGAPRLFSDAALNPEGLRRSDALLRFEARRLDMGRVALKSLSGTLKIDHGLITVAPLRGDLMQGKFDAHLTLDATQHVPAAVVGMTFEGLQLSTLEHKQQEAPMEGLLNVRLDIVGKGSSLHQVAASATGTFRATLPHGKIRASLAELTGVDLRGLGLTLTRSKREAEVRCASATFEARDGTLTAQSIIIDTEPVVIRGEGLIHLDTESLQIALRGEPKDVRLLRLRAPVRISGTLMHPLVGIEAHDSSIKLIDPGHGKDVDCASVLASSGQ